MLNIFEQKYPEDKRPRQAIEAAKNCIKEDTPENQNTARAAAHAVYAAANAADVAAHIAYASAQAAETATQATYAAHAIAHAADAAAQAAEVAIAATYTDNAIAHATNTVIFASRAADVFAHAAYIATHAADAAAQAAEMATYSPAKAKMRNRILNYGMELLKRRDEKHAPRAQYRREEWKKRSYLKPRRNALNATK